MEYGMILSRIVWNVLKKLLLKKVKIKSKLLNFDNEVSYF